MTISKIILLKIVKRLGKNYSIKLYESEFGLVGNIYYNNSRYAVGICIDKNDMHVNVGGKLRTFNICNKKSVKNVVNYIKDIAPFLNYSYEHNPKNYY